MSVVVTKSASITNFDATPIFVPTTGEGIEGPLRTVTDSAVGQIGDTGAAGQIPAASFYRLVRVPTNAKVKRLLVSQFGASGTATGDIDVAYSDSATDGTQQVFATRANPVVLLTASADNKLFGAGVTLNGSGAPVTPTERTFQNTFLPANQNQPLWQVLVNLGCIDFVTDPGGFFDIIVKLTATIAVAAITFNAECDYVE